MSRLLSVTLALVTALAAATASAEGPYGGRYDGVKMIRGTVFSMGRADPNGTLPAAQRLESGTFFDANFSSVILNGGIGTKSFDGHNVANIYGGFGIGRILQIQMGYGDRGTLGRVRTDLNVREVFSFVTGQRQASRERTLADRVTFTYAAERYSENRSEEFNNGTIGIGLLFDGPF